MVREVRTGVLWIRAAMRAWASTICSQEGTAGGSGLVWGCPIGLIIAQRTLIASTLLLGSTLAVLGYFLLDRHCGAGYSKPALPLGCETRSVLPERGGGPLWIFQNAGI